MVESPTMLESVRQVNRVVESASTGDPERSFAPRTADGGCPHILVTISAVTSDISTRTVGIT
jgi:hypothetical protein